MPLPSLLADSSDTLLDSLMDGLYLTGVHGEVLYMNRAARRILGYAEEDRSVLGTPLPATHWTDYTEFAQFCDQMPSSMGIVEQKVQMRTTGGLDISVRYAMQSRWNSDGTWAGIQHLIHLLPYLRYRDTAELRAENRELTALADLSRSLLSTMGVEQAVKGLMHQTQEMVQANGICVLLRGNDEVECVTDESVDEDLAALLTDKADAILNRYLPQLNDVSRIYEGSHTFSADLSFLRRYDINTIVLSPLRAHERPLGLLLLLWYHRSDVDSQQLLLLDRVAQYSGLALLNARLYDDLQRAYDELQNAQAQLVEAERQKVLVEMAGAAAHELNQPLTVLLGYTSLLARRLANDEGLSDTLERIERSTRRISEIVQRLGQITRYRTRYYIEGQPIVDIEAASRPHEDPS